MLRGILNGCYRVSSFLAGFSLFLICAIVFIQVLFNCANKVWELSFGTSPGLLLPSYDSITGYLLVAATFFAAADTYQKGGHIRVNLLLSRIKSVRALLIIEVASVTVVLALMSYAIWYGIRLAMDSFEYKDVSYGIIPIPLWIPQLFMVLGLLTFILALIDHLICLAIYKNPDHR